MKTINTSSYLSFKGPYLLVLILIFLLSQVYGQDFLNQTNSAFTTLPTAQTGGDLVWGDFDADGDMDFVITGTKGGLNPYQTEVFRYNSSTDLFERFPGAATLPAVRNSRPAWGDYDSDGDLDLLIIGQNNQGIRFAKIFNFNGINFTEDFTITPQISSMEVSDGAAAFADYNNDGQLDLVIAGNTGSSNLQLFRHDDLPANGYVSDLSLPGVSSPYLSWGDYDSDGDLDLAYCGTDQAGNPSTKIYTNLGNSNFAPLTSAIPNIENGSIEWGDYDNDGDMDILISGEDNTGTARTEVYKNNGSAGFALVNANLEGIKNGEAVWVDFNNDGWLDISLSGQNGNSPNDRSTRLYENDTNGAFTFLTTASGLLQDVNNGARISWADYNQDNKLDLLLTGTTLAPSNYTFRLYQNNLAVSNTTPQPPTNISSNQSGASVILSWSPPSNLAQPLSHGLTYNLHIGSVPAGENIKAAQADLGNGFYRLSDFGDLKDTLWVISDNNLSSGTTYYWRVQAIDQDFEASAWSAQGSFTYVNPFTFTSVFIDSTGSKFDFAPPGLKDGAIELGDTDNDGDLDLLYCGSDASNNPNLVYYIYDSQTGQFQAGDVTAQEDIRNGDIALGDVDGDGDLDLAICGNTDATTSNPILKIYTNQFINSGVSSKTFGAPFQVLPGIRDASLDFGDVDNDGDLDLLVTGFGGNGTQIYRNDLQNGNFNFISAGRMGLPNVDRGDAKFGDFDNDGYPDVAIMGRSGSNTITDIYRNNGGTSFSRLNNANLTKIFGGEVQWADINNDGFLDILGLGIDANGIPATYVQLNNQGTSFFTGGGLFSGTKLESGGMGVGDLNNDGFNDLVTVGFEDVGGVSTPRSLVYFHNQSPLNPTLSIDNASSSILTHVGLNAAVKLADYNGDNKLDIFLLGRTGVGLTSNTFKLFQNIDASPNSTPDPPTNIQHEIQGFDVGLSWDPPPNYSPFEERSLSYTVLVFKDDGSNEILRYLHSEIDSALSNYGFNRKPSRGNVTHNRELILEGLEPGDYKFAIQTIDQDFEGSTFSPLQSFEFEFPSFIDETAGFTLSSLPRLKEASLSMGDYRGGAAQVNTPDGFLDFVISGEDENGNIRSFLYHFEPGSNTFLRDAPNDANIYQVHRGDQCWGDVNNDGFLDLLVMGQQTSGQPPVARLYFNLLGSFNNSNPATHYRDFTGVRNGFCSLVDFNKDGFRDVFISGENQFGAPVSNLYLSNAKNNVSQLQFSQVNPANLIPFEFSGGDWGDFNNDGNLDLLIGGETALGRKTYILANNGLGDFLPPIELEGLSEGSLSWGDYNSDGFLDVLLSGESNGGPITFVYENIQGSSFQLRQSGLEGLSGGDAAWADYNLDGYKDFIISGSREDGQRSVRLYRYHPSVDSFAADQVAAAPFPPVDQGSASAWADVDQDGKPDLLLAGQRSDSPDSNTFRIFRNIANSSPFTPIAPVHHPEVIDGYDVELSWTAPINIPDSIRPGLSYNVLLGRVSGGIEQRSPQSLLASGQRQVVNGGMVNGETGFRFYNLPDGEYFWRVQAIDMDYEGGPFSIEDTFEFQAPILLDTSRAVFGSTPEGFSSGDLAWGDFDKDGDLDLIVSGNRDGSPTTQIFRNDNGVLVDGPSLQGLIDSRLALGDYDHDEDIDIILSGTLNNGNSATIIQKNNGNGSFTSITNHGIASLREGDIDWIDIDNDGDLDVVISGVGGTSLEADVYENIGGDQFISLGINLTAFKDGAIGIADVNRDGFQDIFFTGDISNSASPQAGSRLYLNTGLKSFTQRNTNVLNLRSSACDWADIDGNGFPDLLISGLNSLGLPQTLLYTNQNLVFTDRNLDIRGVYHASLAFGDYNNDDLPDFVYSGAVDGFNRYASIFENLGSGNFEEQKVPGLALSRVDQGAMAWGDLNGDFNLDLALIGRSANFPLTHDLGIYMNVDSSLNQSPAAPVSLNAEVRADTLIMRWSVPSGQTHHSYNVYVGTAPALGDSLSPSADITSGFRRLAKTGNTAYQNEYKLTGLNNGTYFWSVQSVAPDFEGSGFPTAQSIDLVRPRFVNANEERFSPGIPSNYRSGKLHWGDLDRDGDLDLLINGTDRSGVPVLVVLKNEGGQLELFSGLSGLDQSSLALGDYDNDGDLEVLYSGTQNGNPQIRLFENNGNATLSPIALGGDVPAVIDGSLDWIDHDNDGDLDIFLSGLTAQGPKTAIFENRGGSFVEDTYLNFQALEEASSSWADFDRDGDKDLAISGSNGATAFTGIYRNGGIRGGFTLLTSSEAPLPALKEASLDWGDQDSDGFLDLLLTGTDADSPRTEVFSYNPVSGNFSSTAQLRGIRNGRGIWGDINEDRLQDILVCGLGSNGSPQSYLFINRGGGNYEWDQASSQAIKGLNQADLAWADVDLDGKLDVAVIGQEAFNQGFLGIFANIDSAANEGVSAPTDLSISSSGDSVLLSWQDNLNPTGLHYNVRVGSRIDTADILSPMSLQNGFRQQVGRGNAGSRQSFRLKGLAAGTYYWRVQAVDQDFEGSPFSVVDSFTFEPAHFILQNPVLFDEAPLGFEQAQSAFLDYDNDGFLDVLVLGRNADGKDTSVLFNSDAGRRLIPDSNNSSILANMGQGEVLVEDFNLDGFVDILLTGQVEGQDFTELYFNQGGQFSLSGSPLPTLSNPRLAKGDLNSDGASDLIFTGRSAGQVRTVAYLNNGLGAFNLTNYNLGNVEGGEIIIEDFDQNGLNDVFLLGQNGTSTLLASLYLQDRVQGFQVQSNVLPSSITLNSLSLAVVADADQDSRPDLILTGETGASPAVFQLSPREGGNGSFFEENSFVQDSLPVLIDGNYLWGDYNDDGQVDLAVMGLRSDNTPVSQTFISASGQLPLRQDLLGGFTLPQMDQGSSANWGDVDRDGKLDILLAGQDNGGTSLLGIYRNIEPGTSLPPTAPTNLNIVAVGSDLRLEWSHVDPSYSYNVFLADQEDTLFVTSPLSDTLNGRRRIVGRGNAGYQSQLTLSGLEQEQDYTWGVQSVDASYEGSRFILSSFAFTPPAFEDITPLRFAAIPDPTEEGEILTGDYDLDGDLDLILSSQRDGNEFLRFYRNNGLSFEEDMVNSGSIPAITSGCLKWADIDNDNDPDLFLTGRVEAGRLSIGIYRNDNGIFIKDTLASAAFVPVSGASADWADFDLDGDPDVYVMGIQENGDHFGALYVNREDGSFDIQQNTGETLAALRNGAVAWGDYDKAEAGQSEAAKGHPDLALVGISNNGVATSIIYHNDGKTDSLVTFSVESTPSLLPQLAAGEVFLADLDNNRFPDLIITGSTGSDSITRIFRNEAGIGFQAIEPPLNLPETPSGGLIIGDYDDNGYADLLFTGTEDKEGVRKISLYRNLGGFNFRRDILTSNDLDSLDIRLPAWGDFDKDGKLDLFAGAMTPFGGGQRGPGLLKNINQNPNKVPEIPQDLSHRIFGEQVSLSWPDLVDSTGILGEFTYNLRLGKRDSLSGRWSPLSDLENDRRYIVEQGNIGHNNVLNIRDLPSGSYLWCVQSIGKDYEASPCSPLDSFEFIRPIPEIIAQSITEWYPDQEESVRSSITVRTDTNITDVRVWFKQTASGTWLNEKAAKNGTTYSFDISLGKVDELGVDYYFEIMGRFGYDVLSDTFYTWREYESGIDFENLNFGRNVSDYNLLAIPLDLEDEQISSFMENDEGLGRQNRYRWRFWSWSTPDSNFLEYEDEFTTVESGKGYFLIKARENSFNTGRGRVVQANDEAPYVWNLEQGWNLVGNPFYYNISWEDILEASGPGVDDISSDLLVYRSSYQSGNSLNRLEGAFIFANRPTQLKVLVRKNPNLNRLADPGLQMRGSLGSLDWFLPIKAKQGELENLVSGVGMNPNASLGWDRWDGVLPIRLGAYLETRFEDHGTPLPKLSKDIVPNEDSFIWDFSLKSSEKDPQLELSWPEIQSNGSDKRLYLFDKDNQRFVNMAEVQNYLSTWEEGQRQFRIYYGNQLFLNEQLQPQKVHLGMAYPNPAQKVVMMPLSLPPLNGKYQVSLEVIGMEGKLVKRIFEGRLKGGFHDVKWDLKDEKGRRVAAGTYFYRIKVEGNETSLQTRKLLITTP